MIGGCGDGDSIAPPTTGTIDVITVTTGSVLDPDGYALLIDDDAPQSIATDGRYSATANAGLHTVELTGLEANCSIAGENPRSVTVVAGETATVTFGIACSEGPPPPGSVTITTVTSGSVPDADGYTVSVDGGASQPIGVAETITVSGLAAGPHLVAIEGLAGNCSIEGGNTKVISIQGGAATTLTVAVTCVQPALQWAPMESGTDFTLTSVWGSSSSDVHAVGGLDETFTGGAFHYDGLVWGEEFTTDAGGLTGVWGSAPNDVFAVGGGNFDVPAEIFHFDGVRWSPMVAPVLPENLYTAVWGSSASDVYAVGEYFLGRDILLIAHYDGTSWTTVTLDQPNDLIATDVHGSSGSDVYVVGYQFPEEAYFVAHYNGSTWTQTRFEEEGALLGVWANSPTDVWATGVDGTGGFFIHFDGSAWTKSRLPGAPFLTDMWASSGSDIYAVGQGIFHYDGTTWRRSSELLGTGVWGISAGEVFVVGPDGILRGTP